RGRRSGGRRFGGQRSGGGERWPYPSRSGRRSTLTKFLGSDRLAGNGGYVAAGNAEIVEVTVRKAAQLGNGVPVAAPVAVIADQVHRTSRSSWLVLSLGYER